MPLVTFIPFYLKYGTIVTMVKTNPKFNLKNRGLTQSRGIYSSKELVKLLGHRTAIQRLVEADKLLSLGGGFYSTPKLDPSVAQIQIIARYYPQAVISGISALIIHELSDEKLEKVTVDIPQEMKLSNRLLHARRIAKSRFFGIIQKDYFGEQIRIYDIERALCDAYRIDRGALFFKALKRYLRDCKPDAAKIANYDKVLGTRVLTSLQQEFSGV